MTVRAKPVVRQRRAPWRGPERRNFLLNLGFGLVVVVALLVLVVAAGLSWYDTHLAGVASVNGQTITKDEFNRRAEVEFARLEVAESRILDEFNAGRLTEDQRDQQLQILGRSQEQVAQRALERLIDARIQADLAAQEGIVVTSEDIEAQIVEEATRPEQRFAWIIEVAPKIEADADEPTAAAKAEAKAKAEQALADLRSGKDWVEVAKAVSTDSSAALGGELGWVSEDFDPNEAFADAVFAIEPGGMTDLLVDEDGVYRIGRVTDIVPAQVDPDYRLVIANRGASVEAFEQAVRQDLIDEKLREKIEGQALAAGPQRRVAEIFLQNEALPEQLPEGSVKARHILFSPKDDPNGARDLDEADPAWKEAEDAARKTYNELRTFLERFDQRARELSDEPGADISGGKLPWFDPSQVAAEEGLDPAFGAAIFKEGLQPGQLLEPVRSSFGWHVIQVLYFPTDEDQAARLKAQIEAGTLEFADAAREYSAGEEAVDGGEIGWIAKYQLDQRSEAAIFATPVGKLTDPVAVDGDGVHLYQVIEEAVRTPEGEQRETIEQQAFDNWYQPKKAEYTIDRDLALGG